jgi:serine/threonine protein kinase
MNSNGALEIQRVIHPGRLLGEGGMGRVIDGFAPDLGQFLAVKHLRAEWMQDGEVRSRFEEEAAIMASIDHPGVLPVYGMGLDDERRLFYVMKKVEGHTLGRVMAETASEADSVPRRRRLVDILLNVCETVAAAHHKGIVHRDLKPDNILVDQALSVYVIDWGLAKRSGPSGGTFGSERTLPGKIMGTPGYMAPEQADGRSARAGAEADVFALGAMLYEILTGKRPFEAEDDHTEMLAAIHQDPEPPRRSNWLLPRDITAICLKALHKDPTRRYPDAGSLANDLRAHLEGRPVTAIRPNPIERLRYAARRHPMRALASASVICAVAAVAAFVLSQRWLDHRLADKAMARIQFIENEITEIDRESAELRDRLTAPSLPAEERTHIQGELEVNDSRWILAQFEVQRALSSVTELRFIRTDPEIVRSARQRLIEAIEACIQRGHPALGQAVAETYLERVAEGAVIAPIAKGEIERIQALSRRAAAARAVKNN